MGRKYECDYDFFKEIDTEEKAYWLGFLYADGCVHKSSHQMTLVLSIEDKEHLYKFNRCLKSTYPIKLVRDKYVRLNISSKSFGEDLINKGCVPTKSLILKFPSVEQVPKSMVRHFIRGYFDGDGCIYNRMKDGCMKSCINILGTEDFLVGIVSELPVDNVVVKQRNGYKIHNITIYNKQDIKKIMLYFYNESNIYLKRKYDKFLDMARYMDMRLAS